MSQRVDATYPDNTALTIDHEGTPHLKRLHAQPVPEALHTLEALLKERMPERHLLDILKNVHHWVHYTRHFGPPSGADPKLTEPVLRYLFTIFGYASELGASQTARHTNGLISRQVLRRMNDQHITATKLESGVLERSEVSHNKIRDHGSILNHPTLLSRLFWPRPQARLKKPSKPLTSLTKTLPQSNKNRNDPSGFAGQSIGEGATVADDADDGRRGEAPPGDQRARVGMALDQGPSGGGGHGLVSKARLDRSGRTSC